MQEVPTIPVIPLTSVVFSRLTDTAVLPKRATDGSAGYDLTADESLSGITTGWGVRRVKTGITIRHMPKGCYARIAMRSSLAVNRHFVIDAGVVDSDYRGELIVCFHTVGPASYEIANGERIAQLIFERIITPDVVEWASDESFPSADESTHTGFGSTGV